MDRLDGQASPSSPAARRDRARRIARAFVAEGAQVVIADVAEEPGQALADELGRHAAYFRRPRRQRPGLLDGAGRGRQRAVRAGQRAGQQRRHPALRRRSRRCRSTRSSCSGRRQPARLLPRHAGGRAAPCARQRRRLDHQRLLDRGARRAWPTCAAYAATKFAIRGMTKGAAHGARAVQGHPGQLGAPRHDRHPDDPRARRRPGDGVRRLEGAAAPGRPPRGRRARSTSSSAATSRRTSTAPRSRSTAASPRPTPSAADRRGQPARADRHVRRRDLGVPRTSSAPRPSATYGPQGQIHLVGMWYAVLDGQVWIETKAKAQKVVNLRRDPRMSFLVEAGHTYDQLRGVALEGTGVVVEDADVVWDVCVNIFNRYNGAVHRGDEAVRGVHGQEPRRRPPRRRPGPVLGPPQAGDARDGAGREHGGVRRVSGRPPKVAAAQARSWPGQ